MPQLDWVMVLAAALGSLGGGMLGAMIGTRLAWRRQFVTRDEAMVMARQIDDLARSVLKLQLSIRQ